MIYLDNQATTPCDARVVEAMLPFFAAEFANPHSADHAGGRRAADAVENSRDAVAVLLGADRREIVFTSGATEADNLAIKGAARFHRAAGGERRRVVTVATEHAAVLDTVRDLADDGFEPVVLPVDRDGTLDPDRLADALRTPTILVSVMAANNETGVLADLAPLAALARGAGALLHSDAAQAAGKVPFDVAALDLDLASVSAHKLYGPKGIGALWVRRRPRVRLQPLFSGGGQERGLRPGTLPVPLAVGFGRACAIAAAERADEAVRLLALRDELERRLAARVPGLVLNGARGARLPGNLNLRFPDVDAPALIRHCPTVAMSTGAACGSADWAPSAVLRAMGLDVAAARGSLRLGLGRFTSPDDVARAADAIGRAWGAARASASVAAIEA